MHKAVVVIGAGGFGREVVDVIEAVNSAAEGAGEQAPWDLLGIVDDTPTEVNLERLAQRSLTWLGTTEDFLRDGDPSAMYAVGIGNPAVRRRVAERFDAAGHVAATLVHPSVTMGAVVTLGEGSVLCAGARLTTNITLGRHVHVNLNTTIGHDVTIGDCVSMNPLASISGDVVIEDDVLVGVGGIVLNGLTVGRGATVGGAACAVKDVEAGSTVVGVPARPLAAR